MQVMLKLSRKYCKSECTLQHLGGTAPQTSCFGAFTGLNLHPPFKTSRYGPEIIPILLDNSQDGIVSEVHYEVIRSQQE